MQLIAASVNVLLAAAKHSTLKKSQSFFLDKVATMNGGGGNSKTVTHNCHNFQNCHQSKTKAEDAGGDADGGEALAR